MNRIFFTENIFDEPVVELWGCNSKGEGTYQFSQQYGRNKLECLWKMFKDLKRLGFLKELLNIRFFGEFPKKKTMKNLKIKD